MLRRTFATLGALLLIAVAVIGLLSYQSIRTYSDQVSGDYLKAAANQAATRLAAGAPAAAVATELQAAFRFQGTPVRLTLIRRDGTVLFDSSSEAASMENHLSRAEVAAALGSLGYGTAIRYSATQTAEVHYYALYNETTQLVVRTAILVRAAQASLNRLLLTVGLILLALIAVLLLIGRRLTDNVVTPLQKLKEATAAMAAGKLDSRVDKMLLDDSEVAVLSRSFNQMAERLEQNVDALADQNAHINAILDAMTDPLIAVSDRREVTFLNALARSRFGHDIDPEEGAYPLFYITHHEQTERMVESAMVSRKPVTAELILTTVQGPIRFAVIASPIRSESARGAIITFHDITELRKAQQIRSDFVANVTHELKTPLTSIRGFIETLRQGAISKPEVAERFIDIIDIEAERLSQLINDVLALSEIENETGDRERETFDLRETIDNVIVLLDDTAAAARVALLTDEEARPLMVSASRHRIKQILINLVDNAIKYNRPNGKVFIRASREAGGQVVIRVRDTGVGIAPEHQDRIFERFYRVDRSRSRELGGTGLGLAIVKHIAQLYGGYATVRSEPGTGSEFTVRLDI